MLSCFYNYSLASLELLKIPSTNLHSDQNMGSIESNTERRTTSECLQSDSSLLADQCGWERKDANGYEILERPYGIKRPFKVIHIGAGASGINFAKFARDLVPDVEVQIYDKNDEIGGTWLENR